MDGLEAVSDSGALARTAQSQSQSQSRLRQVAEEFEAIFLKQVMAQGDDPFGHGGLSGQEASNAERQFESLFHDTLAERGAGGTGIADTVHAWLVRHSAGGGS
ncbi:MAG: hypothetical protein ACOCZK_02595 [Planctomycetota bacterium]